MVKVYESNSNCATYKGVNSYDNLGELVEYHTFLFDEFMFDSLEVYLTKSEVKALYDFLGTIVDDKTKEEL